MGFSITKQDNNITYNLKEFVCDTKADVKRLPTKCAYGSLALCIEDGDVYVLNTQNKWVPLNAAGTSGGSGGTGDGGNTNPDLNLEYATKVDIDNLFD